MQNSFDYYAFISYKREDEEWAKRLQKQLEGYNIPSAIRKEIPRIPKHVRPIFRDKTDLGAGGLTTSLHTELERSRYLIVICSPHSAQSEWVGKEIEHFRQLGREKDVIPFIVDGVPHSGDPRTECFNPVFERFEDEPLGISVQEIGRNQALVKVLAKMLDIRFNRLWDRHKRNLRKKKIMGVAACGLAAVLGLLYWEYTRPMFEYYADYVDKWGIPEGVVSLNKQQAKRRHDMYRFEYRRVPLGHFGSLSWRLKKVAYVNSAGTVIEHGNTEMKDRTSIVEIEYGRKSGDVTQINQCNRSGKVVMRSKISSMNGKPASLVDLQGSTDSDASGYLGASTSSMSSQIFSAENGRTSIKRYALTRDVDGHITRRTYHANNDDNISNSAVSDADGIFGMEYSLDSLGRVLEITYLGCDYNPAVTKKGITGKKYKYDEHGIISKVVYVGEEGTPVMNDLLWAQCEIITDKNGNIVEVSIMDSDGKPCLCSDGYAKHILRYDDRGNVIESLYFGANNKPCLCSDGYSKAKIKYDDRGNEIEHSYFGTDSQLCLCFYNYAKDILRYDNRGNVMECSYFGVDGHPCFHSGGIARWTSKYDDRGNEIEHSYFGTDGQLCLCFYNYAKHILRYDDRGNVIECSYFGVDGHPCFNSDGIARWTSKYDDRGNEIVRSFFDTDGQPCLCSSGYAKYTSQYDESGNIIEWSCFGEDGMPCFCDCGYAKHVIKYDNKGNIIEWSYFGTDGQLCMHSEGLAKSIHKYDNRGNEIERAFFDTNGEPCYEINGAARQVTSYDDRGNVIGRSYFGTDGQPCLCSGGYALWLIKYDDRGNVVEWSFYDTAGQLCLCSNGYAKHMSKYDDRDNEIECSYFGVDGHPCLIDAGYAIKRREYNDREQIIEESYYDAQDIPCLDYQGISKVINEWDEKGLLANLYCYGTDGKPIMNKYNFWRYETTYNKRMCLSKRTTYDINNQPCVSSMGYCTIEWERDRYAQVISTSYYDDQGNMLSKTYDTQKLATPLNMEGITESFVYSVVIQWNGWRIGDPIDELYQIMKSSKYGEKHLVLLDVEGKAHEITKMRGTLGVTLVDSTIPEETYKIAKNQLDSIARSHRPVS